MKVATDDLTASWLRDEHVDPGPFVALGLCSDRWLSAHLDALRSAAGAARFAGDAFLHFDVRSDNVCFRAGGSAILIDWNLTAVGNAQLDVAFWLPSLENEGGPSPEEVLPGADPGLVSACAAFFCARAARPPIATAPTVRGVQLEQDPERPAVGGARGGTSSSHLNPGPRPEPCADPWALPRDPCTCNGLLRWHVRW